MKIGNILSKTKKIDFEDEEPIRGLKDRYLHSERRFFHGGVRYVADSLDCHASPGTLEMSLVRLAGLLKGNGGNNRLLNLGGGTGQTSGILMELGFDVTNVDMETNEENGENIRFDLNGEKDLPFGCGIFDFVFCQEVVEHIENPWRLFRLSNRVLKKNGFFVLTTPNILSAYSRRMFNKTGYFHWFTPKNFSYHINPVPAWEVELIAERTGFLVKEVRGNGEYFLGQKRAFTREEVLDKSECLVFIMAKR